MAALSHIVGLRDSDYGRCDSQLAAPTTVYHCLVCGPIMREHYDHGTVTFHRNVPHPADMTYNEEERPQ